MILDGLKLSKKISLKLKNKIAKLKISPKLVIVQIGDLDQSNIFIGRKVKFAQSIGAIAEIVKFKEDALQDEVEEKIRSLNSDNEIHGIIIQLPLPKHLNFYNLVDIIDQKKDVDGLGKDNLKYLWHSNEKGLKPATVRGILELFSEYKIDCSGKKVAIINRSILVGKPLAHVLLALDATVLICHSKTKNLEEEIRSVDIVVTAVGKPKIFGSTFFRENQIVIDVGISHLGQKIPEEDLNRKIYGDVDFENVKDKVKAISPVPGGIGPMTVASLFLNLLDSIKS